MCCDNKIILKQIRDSLNGGDARNSLNVNQVTVENICETYLDVNNDEQKRTLILSRHFDNNNSLLEIKYWNENGEITQPNNFVLGECNSSTSTSSTILERVCETYTDSQGKEQKRTLSRIRVLDKNNQIVSTSYYDGETSVTPDLTKVKEGQCKCCDECDSVLAPIVYQGELKLTTTTGQAYQPIIPAIQVGEKAGFGGTIDNKTDDDIQVNIGFIEGANTEYREIIVPSGDIYSIPDGYFASVEVQVIDSSGNPVDASADGRVIFYSQYKPKKEECIVYVSVPRPQLLKGLVYADGSFFGLTGDYAMATKGYIHLFLDQNIGGSDIIYNIEVIKNDSNVYDRLSSGGLYSSDLIGTEYYFKPKTSISIPSNGVPTVFSLYEENPDFNTTTVPPTLGRFPLLPDPNTIPVTPTSQYLLPDYAINSGYFNNGQTTVNNPLTILRLTTTDPRVSNEPLDVIFYRV